MLCLWLGPPGLTVGFLLLYNIEFLSLFLLGADTMIR